MNQHRRAENYSVTNNEQVHRILTGKCYVTAVRSRSIINKTRIGSVPLYKTTQADAVPITGNAAVTVVAGRKRGQGEGNAVPAPAPERFVEHQYY